MIRLQMFSSYYIYKIYIYIMVIIACMFHDTRGGSTSSKKHVHSILRYVESLRGFTEIKQVSAHSIQVCWGSMLGTISW